MEATMLPMQGIPPESPEKWAQLTSSKMLRARSQASDILSRLQQYEAAEAASKAAAQEQAKREREKVKQAAKKRVKCHEEVINGSQRCIRHIEDAMQRLEDTLSKLTHERYARHADQQVNNLRFDMRAKRPPAENFKDPLEKALEAEKAVLVKARKDLLEREAEVKGFHKKLAELRVGLSKDTGTRRLQVEHELAGIKFASSSTHLPAIPQALPQEVEAGSAEATDGGGHEGGAPPDALIKTTSELLQNVEGFIERSEEAIARSRKEAFAGTTQVGRALARRTLDMAQLKRDLEQHVSDVNYAIGAAERSVEKQQKRLDPKDTAKKDKLDATKGVLENLKTTRAELIEDLRCKIHALDIDNACRRVTPQVAAETKRPSSAAARKKGLRGSASAPNLKAADGSPLSHSAGLPMAGTGGLE